MQCSKRFNGKRKTATVNCNELNYFNRKKIEKEMYLKLNAFETCTFRQGCVVSLNLYSSTISHVISCFMKVKWHDRPTHLIVAVLVPC